MRHAKRTACFRCIDLALELLARTKEAAAMDMNSSGYVGCD